MPDQENPCEYCYHPPRQVEGLEGLHNPGCPMINPADMAEWRRGRSFGFADNHIQAWEYRFYTSAFILGWRAGKDEIDGLVEQAAESNYS